MQKETTEYSVNGFPLPTRATRRKIVYATLLFTWSLIAFIVYAGDPSNSLHTSALSWAFSLSAATIFAYVFGAVVDNWNSIRNLGVPTVNANKK